MNIELIRLPSQEICILRAHSGQRAKNLTLVVVGYRLMHIVHSRVDCNNFDMDKYIAVQLQHHLISNNRERG